jgi:lipopolysaccharide transport system ATP-binding protein
MLHVLNDVSFSVKKGEMLGILGKNGIGKTTLLRLIAGIYKPDAGTITINGKLIPFLAIGTGFHPELTAIANVKLYSILLGISRNEIKNKLDEIIEFAELEKFADSKIKHFSAGMSARLAFSTAIHMDPDVLLMDEIISVGDLSFQQKSYDACMSLKNKGKSIILVTHSMQPVRQFCDRAIFLNKGKIESIGNTEEVVTEYEKMFT